MFRKREAPLRYYDREMMPYAADRQRIAELESFLKTAPWQVFATLTFGWKPSDEAASQAFDLYINRVERTLKADVCYVRGDEKRFSGCGQPATGRHYHALMASAAPLCPAVLEFLWKCNSGNHDAALVLPYDLNRNGLAYVLKLMHAPNGGWKFGKLHLVLPGLDGRNHQERRNLRRHQERLKAFARIELPKLNPGGTVPAVTPFGSD